MRKAYLFLVLILSISYVSGFNASIEATNSKIYLDESALFKLIISNPGKTNRYFTVHSSDVSWYVDLEPSLLMVAPDSETEYDLRLIPNAWAETGMHIIRVSVDSDSDSIEFEVPIYVKSYEDSGKTYSPSIELRTTIPDEIDPRENIEFEVYVRNRNKLDIKSLGIEVGSPFFSDLKHITLGPMEERRETYYYPIDIRTEPKIVDLEVSIIYENKTTNREKVSFEIKPYSEFVIKEDVLKELFKETTDYVITNDGNIRKKDSLIVEVGFFDRFFIQTSPEHTGKGKNYLKWDFELKPDEETRVIVTFNYRPFFYVVLLIILSYLMYYLFRSPILLKKEALVMGSTKEGISELKVLIHVRNRSPELVEKLALTDLLPSITELGKDIHIGSITPTKILRNDKKGTLVKWELEALEPLEERIITYKLKTKIIIVGGLTLPRARIKFKTKDAERTVKSNKTKIEKTIE